MPYDLFISFAHEDWPVVGQIAEGLNLEGYSVWTYFTKAEYLKDHLLQAPNAIEECWAFMVVISPRSLRSLYVDREIHAAADFGRVFVPVLLDLTFEDLARHKPEWRHAIGGAVPFPLPSQRRPSARRQAPAPFEAQTARGITRQLAQALSGLRTPSRPPPKPRPAAPTRAAPPLSQEPLEFDYPLANRTEELCLFRDLLAPGAEKRFLFLSGRAGLGKSMLLSQFAKLARCHDCRDARSDFKSGRALAEVLVDLVLELAPLPFPRFDRARKRRELFSQIRGFLQDLDGARTPSVLMLDAYEQATEEAQDWVERKLLPQLCRNNRCRLVIAGQRVPAADSGKPWSDLAVHRELLPIDSAPAWCEFAHRVLRLEGQDDFIRKLVLATKGDPGNTGSLLANLKQHYSC